MHTAISKSGKKQATKKKSNLIGNIAFNSSNRNNDPFYTNKSNND